LCIGFFVKKDRKKGEGKDLEEIPTRKITGELSRSMKKESR